MTASSSAARVVAAWLLLVPAAARADPPPAPPTDAQIEAARALYRQALDLSKAGRIAAAVDRALEAYRTAATPVTALEAAELLTEAGRLVQARDVARAVAQLPVSPRESDKGRDARSAAADLAASLDARIPKMAFAGRPPAAEVWLDGAALGAVDGGTWRGVDPGAHTVVVRVGGASCASIAATLAEREERTLDLHGSADACTLPRAAAAARETPAAPPPPSAGLGPRRWIGVSLGAAGVVAVAVAGALALTAKSDYDSVASSCPPAGCTRGAYDVRESARSRADVATALMVAGGASAAAGAILFFWPRGDGAPVEAALGAGELRLRVPF